MGVDSDDEARTLDKLRGLPFLPYQVRSRPNVSGYWWVDRMMTGSWEVVSVVLLPNGDSEVYRCGASFEWTIPVETIYGKWYGPILPTQFGV